MGDERTAPQTECACAPAVPAIGATFPHCVLPATQATISARDCEAASVATGNRMSPLALSPLSSTPVRKPRRAVRGSVPAAPDAAHMRHDHGAARPIFLHIGGVADAHRVRAGIVVRHHIRLPMLFRVRIDRHPAQTPLRGQIGVRFPPKLHLSGRRLCLHCGRQQHHPRHSRPDHGRHHPHHRNHPNPKSLVTTRSYPAGLTLQVRLDGLRFRKLRQPPSDPLFAVRKATALT
jgi:hypothetical protein